MPIRVLPLANDEYYHVFNRGVALQPTFYNKKDFERFIICLSYYRFKDPPCKLSRLLQLKADERVEILNELDATKNKLVDLLAYCLMPNHFHLLLKQISEDGISTFLRLITNSYTKYVNVKSDRVGPLFQGSFKAVRIQSDEQLLHVSRYVHLNPLTGNVVKNTEELFQYPWSSLPEYMNGKSTLSDPMPILTAFNSKESYQSFLKDQADYQKQLDRLKHLLFEDKA